MGERHRVGELFVEGIGREHGSRPGVELGDDMQLLAVTRRAEHPLVVGKDAQVPRRRAPVRQRQQRELDGIDGVHEDIAGRE